jgi:hypothetical protein
LIEDEAIEEQVDIGDPVFYEGNDGDILYGDGNETLVVRKKLAYSKR